MPQKSLTAKTIWAPSNAFNRVAVSSRLACTTSAPLLAKAFAFSLDVLRVIARTRQPLVRNVSTTEPP